jgi:hypothetical protein
MKENLERAFWAIQEMWGRRYDTDDSAIPDTKEGEPFGCPVAVDLGQLAVAQTEILSVARAAHPELFRQWQDRYEELPETPQVVSLDAHRIRVEQEFEDEHMAYIEALWGRETFAFNAVVRDLEAIRRGTEDPQKPLRPPATYYEAALLVRHVRSLANALARHFNIEDQVRPEDDDLERG